MELWILLNIHFWRNMSDLYNKAFEHTMKNEGGYADHPADRGGETFMGITRKNHPDWEGWESVDNLKKSGHIKDAHKLPAMMAQAQSFYKKHYWDRVKAENFEGELSLVLFDTSVHSGVGRASKLLQESVGYIIPNIAVDGKIGRLTIQAVQGFISMKDVNTLITIYSILRGKFYLDIIARDKTQTVFLRNWMRRVGL